MSPTANPLLPSKDLISPDAEPGVTKKVTEHSRQPSFLIAVTGKNGKPVHRPSNHQSEYAVPMNNMPIKQRLPGGQVQVPPQNGGHQSQGRTQRPSNLQLGNSGDAVDGYNYTLSTSNQYRRPSVSSPEHNAKMVTPFARASDIPRKESFKKGSGKIPTDVIRNVDPSLRSSSTSSSDSDSVRDEGYHGNKQRYDAPTHAPPRIPPKHTRTRSISCEDTPQNLSADHIDMHNHRVMKPKPNMNHNYENIDNMSHTPVQSGLATLPRNKKKMAPPEDKLSAQHSKLQHQNSYPADHVMHSRESSTNTLKDEHQHSRQTSDKSQVKGQYRAPSAGEIRTSEQPQKQGMLKHAATTKPPKPAKPEKKSCLKKINPPSVPERKTPVRSERTTEDRTSPDYINRNMVERILNVQNQKLTRQGSNASTMSQNSNTSYESDNSSLKSHNSGVNITTEIPYDAVSLESQRDSGYGTSSSDRNSSSSTGSTTLDPYTQYFLSKSMIPPKNINQQAAQEKMNYFLRSGPAASGDRYGPTYTVAAQYNAQYTGHQVQGHPQGQQGSEFMMDPKQQGQGQDRKQLYDPAIVKSHGSHEKGKLSKII